MGTEPVLGGAGANSEQLLAARLRTPLSAWHLDDLRRRSTGTRLTGREVGCDYADMLGEIDRLKVELADTVDALNHTQRRVTELHQGEQPYTDEAIVATPAQMIWRWNRATPERRMEVAALIRDASDRYDRYQAALRRIAERCAERQGGGNCTPDCASEIARTALTGRPLGPVVSEGNHS